MLYEENEREKIYRFTPEEFRAMLEKHGEEALHNKREPEESEDMSMAFTIPK